MTVHTLSVSGLRCAHCVQVLERNLRRVPGVRRVEIRPPREEVEVDVDPRFVQETALEAAIRDSGLHVQRGHRRALFDLPVPPELDVEAPEAASHGHGHEHHEHDHGGGDLGLGGLDLGELDFGEPERGGGGG